MAASEPSDPVPPAGDPARAALALDTQLCFAVYSTAHAFNRLYKPLLDRLGLTYPQYLVMLVLWAEDDQTVGAIGERLMLETSTLTPCSSGWNAPGWSSGGAARPMGGRCAWH
ncbi:MarR family winged helix-turn-helix transcriptional regulator [Sphingomonas changnyeongensis]|uniref:MarR family winged helix-turn-helix transcriptional regulator n=1 Tax=Sphingomonas changnyeongensis TaxID=2698679 RepID=UPI002E17F78C